jgi:hypothetical protein
MPKTPVTAIQITACNGCPHQIDPSGVGFCYLFRDPPDTLPCSQKALADGTARPISMLSASLLAIHAFHAQKKN